MMELAQRMEKKYRREKNSKSNIMRGAYRSTSTTLTPRTRTMSFQREASKEKSSGVRPRGNFKQLIEANVQDKWVKGLCFRCDERYTLGCRCKDRTLQVLTICDDEEAEEGDRSEASTKEEKLHLDMVDVSLNSVVGFYIDELLTSGNIFRH
ncbi:hypothetical protein MA16_Dca027949 [Dendrobium catenatum]|uniref:Uncharacterized protein n=1 Tax=Dendrobium catenatum TaxID=906689 RepID=A0A2I0V9K5_9ASPA|nr:hypothetical protein MA16_Dca027949 [Dendrobium catenatum]